MTVQAAGEQALQIVRSVIRNPEIQAIVPGLLDALQDPARKSLLAWPLYPRLSLSTSWTTYFGIGHAGCTTAFRIDQTKRAKWQRSSSVIRK